MDFNSILCSPFNLILTIFLLFSCSFGLCYTYDEPGYNTFTVSSFSYPQTTLRPFDLRYIRVDLPSWFSSLSISLNSDVDLDVSSIEEAPESTLPVICFRDGSPPLPDVSNSSSLKDLGIQAFQNVEQCFPMQKNITMKLTNEQISPGAWYFGLFNGIGPTRTQSKMIVRGPAYAFSANITVEGCITSTMWGQYCNQTVDPLSCVPSAGNFAVAKSYNQTSKNVVSCKNSLETSCLGDGELKVYFLEVMGVAEELTIMAMNIRLNVTATDNFGNFSGINLMCFARHGAVPSAALNDYSSNISKAPLSIHSPKVGRWYIAIVPVNISKELGGTQDANTKVCYSMESQVLECPIGKAGSNCTWERYVLQTVLRRGSSPFESYYLPVSGNVFSNAANFPLEPLLSNSSYGGKPDDIWTYFLLEIPRGAAGSNIHIRLTSDAEINYEVYARFGGLPSIDSWDYYYANSTRSSDGSMFFMLSNSSKEKIDFYILYVREGIWGFGLRHLNTSSSASKDQTIMSVSLERCPKRCSSHGDCRLAFDASGLTSYSFCSCDRRHGGFDCSIEIISHQGHIWQSICLIASNAAAVLPAFWALRQKALAEWVVFTASGISSGLYHACDVGTWCPLTFNVLQFMDFWLSFMAVVSTFVYLAQIDEVYKRAIHTAVAILTALMAATKATRSSNIVLVIAIGALGLLIGWLIEISTKYRSFSFPIAFSFNMFDRWQALKVWLRNLIKTFFKRFRWVFLLAGFTILAFAAISWKLETSESYWIWHSVWHVTIYTSSFFFLCSKALNVNNENQSPPGNYQLTRQDSYPRDQR
ncbi:transmembrane protein 8b [Fagus crenata]